MQIACRNNEVAKNVGISLDEWWKRQVALGLKIGIAAEYSVGQTWSDTH